MTHKGFEKSERERCGEKDRFKEVKTFFFKTFRPKKVTPEIKRGTT